MTYTETERRILDMWPKFEDGCYVQLGDKAVANSGENKGREFIVRNVYFENGHGKLRSSVSDGCYWTWKAADPYVKRPAPKVLDADGVEIKVGDRVYSIENGNSYTVRSVNGSGTIEFEGFDDKGWSPKFFTHMQPAIDADGVLIKIGDTVWVDGVSESCEVVEVENSIVQVRYADGDTFECCSSDLTHKQSDSWELIKDDATMSPWLYCDKHGLVVDRSGGEIAPTIGTFTLDLISRAKALAEKEAAR